MCLWVQVHAYLDIGMVGAWVGGRMGKQTCTLFWLNHVRGKRRPHDTQLRRASAGIVREQERFLTKLQRSRCTAPGEMGHTALSQKPRVLPSPPVAPVLGVLGTWGIFSPDAGQDPRRASRTGPRAPSRVPGRPSVSSRRRRVWTAWPRRFVGCPTV